MNKLFAAGLLFITLSGGMLIVPARGHAATLQVTASDSFLFSPDEVTIDVGDTVHWSWSTTIEHSVRADDASFTSGPNTTSGNFEHTFDTAGTFRYYCELHGGEGGVSMSGTVIVQDAATATTAAGSATSTPTRTPTRTPSPTGTLSPTATVTPPPIGSPVVPISAPETALPAAAGSAPAVRLPDTGVASSEGSRSDIAGAMVVTGLALIVAAAGVRVRIRRC